MNVQLEERIISGLVPIFCFFLWKFAILLLPIALLLGFWVLNKCTFNYAANHTSRFADAAVTALLLFILLATATFASSVLSSDAKGFIPQELPELFWQLSFLVSTVYFLFSVLFLAITGFLGKEHSMWLCIKPFQALTKRNQSNKTIQPIANVSAD